VPIPELRPAHLGPAPPSKSPRIQKVLLGAGHATSENAVAMWEATEASDNVAGADTR
jgi:hypothetical protein